MQMFVLRSFVSDEIDDYFQCGKVDVKSKFKKCAGCEVSYYCSIHCQRTDWKSGFHRSACKDMADEGRGQLNVVPIKIVN